MYEACCRPWMVFGNQRIQGAIDLLVTLLLADIGHLIAYPGIYRNQYLSSPGS